MRRALCFVAFTLGTACGGGSSPSSPSVPNGPIGPLEGLWAGMLTITASRQVYVGPISVRFTTTPLTSGYVYRAHIVSENPYFPIINTGDATIAPPGTPPTLFTLEQNYASPRATCRGLFHAAGQLVTANHIDADVLGFESCAVDYSGRLVMNRR